MQIIVRRTDSRWTSVLLFLFLVGLGLSIPAIVRFTQGDLLNNVLGWVFCTLFMVVSLLPLDSVFRPDSSILAIENGILGWCNVQQGKKAEEGRVPVDRIKKLVKRTHRGTGLAFVEIQLLVADGTVMDLPQSLLPAVHSRRIVEAIQNANPRVEVEEIEVGELK